MLGERKLKENSPQVFFTVKYVVLVASPEKPRSDDDIRGAPVLAATADTPHIIAFRIVEFSWILRIYNIFAIFEFFEVFRFSK